VTTSELDTHISHAIDSPERWYGLQAALNLPVSCALINQRGDRFVEDETMRLKIPTKRSNPRPLMDMEHVDEPMKAREV
jgi:hypothetical protein